MILIHHFPLFWAVERDAVDRTFLTRSTMQETAPPFRLSRWAFRIRVSPWHWLHIGSYRYHTNRNYWGLQAHPNDIGAWRDPSKNSDPERSVPPIQPGGTDRSVGERDESSQRVLRRAFGPQIRP